MLKKTLLVLMLSLLCLSAFACGDSEESVRKDREEEVLESSTAPTDTLVHTHNFSDATCDTAQTCSCGETQGEPLGHEGGEATCIEKPICTRCGKSYGEPLRHDYAEATYTAPQTCTRCGETTGEKLKLSTSCGMLLCTGYDGSDCYELVANQIDGYPDSTFEFGVIKNNEWLVEMSSNCPFINENGWWKGAKYGNNPGKFKYINAGCFYYSHNDGIGLFEMIYKPETGKYFEVSGLVSFTMFKTEFGEVDYSKLCNDKSEFLARINDGHYTFSYINLNTGETKAIPLKLHVNNNQDIGLLSDGLFYAYGGSNFTGTDYWGFFDLNGNQIIDLTQYDTTDLKDYQFRNGKYTITCKNNSGVKFNITFDTSGNIISQEKAEN